MDKRVVVVGGSIAGLGASIALARSGWSVTIIERDPGPATESGDEAFLTWGRRNVAQFRQPHAFSSRSRNLLLRHAPEVLDRLAGDGVESTNIFKLVAPPDIWTEEDDKFEGLMVRRPVFELALRRTAEVEPGITFVCPASAGGLVIDRRADAVPTVSGVRLEDGTELPADVVLDCGGRRTLVPGWLKAAGVDVPYESQDCDTTYYTRHFRLRPESTMPMVAIFAVTGGVAGALQLLAFPGDHGVFGVCLATMSGDEELRGLRHNDLWTAALAVFPGVVPWVDEANASPINDVDVMGGSRNIRRHFVVGGRPLVRGLLPIGDSLCSTNPAYGWGASMALTYAFSAVDAMNTHTDDLTAMVLAYDEAVGPEADAVYRESAAADRARIYEWRGIEMPAEDRGEMERQDLIARGLRAGATRDPVLGRAFLRRSHLLDRPDEVFDDPEVLAHAISMRERMIEREKSRPQPTRDDVLAAIATAGAVAQSAG